MPPASLSELEEELRQDPRSRQFFDLAKEYQKLGRIEAAQDLCEKGLLVFPNHWQARLLLSQIYVTKGKLDDGRQMVEKVLMAFHDSVPANHMAADIYWAMGEREKALKHYQIVDLLQPGQSGVAERLADLRDSPALLREEAGDLPSSGTEFEPLADSTPEIPALSPPSLEPAAIADAGLPESEDDMETGEHEASWIEAEAPASELDADTASFSTVLDHQEEQAQNVPVMDSDSPGESLKATDDVADDVEELASSSDHPESPEDGPPGLNTFTLAELYEKQGYPEKAVEIYQRMLLHQPDNPVIHGRIRDLMARMAGEAPEAPGVHQEDVEKAMRQKRVLVLQGWLRRVREGRHV